MSGKLSTIKQFVESNPAFAEGGIRAMLFYKGEAAEQAGAVVRFGRKILIDEEKFIEWVRVGGAKTIRGAA